MVSSPVRNALTLPPAMLKRAQKLASKENRMMSELIREALRRYEQAVDPNEMRRQALAEFRQVLAELRKDALAAGTAKLTSRVGQKARSRRSG